MGLLDDLLGQLTAAPSGRTVDAQRGTGGVDMTRIMMALLPIVLGMLGGSRSERSAGLDRRGTGGGLGDILGQMLGGRTGGAGGGLGDLLEHFQRAGFGEQARSWVSTGRNQPLAPEAFEQVFGRGGIAEIARRTGLSEQEASRGLSQLMPEVVDRVTPDGEVPDFASLQASVASLAKRLGTT
jgi:uncharacterized protein YidB (DUF937 family)